MRIITYNVNGIRAAISKGLIDWMQQTDPDVLCLQEIKASPEQVGVMDLEALGYHHYWYPAQKKGYSGVAIFSKIKPKQVIYGCGIKDYDDEGRVIRADFDDVSVMSVYHPSGSSGDDRQAFKMKWLNDFQAYIANLKVETPHLILSGDFNICHKAIDIHNPKSNANTSGFLPEERDWMSKWFASGFTDAFRHANPDLVEYSWWSYRAGARGNNKGWRIDYLSISDALQDQVVTCRQLLAAIHSDHCPVWLQLTAN